VDPISGEGSDSSGCTNTAPASSTTPQTSKQKGRQGADLVKDMYKMFDGSALVALGKHSLKGSALVTLYGVQVSSYMSISNDLFDETGS